MSYFYEQVIPAIERALALDLPEIEEERRKPGSGLRGTPVELETHRRRPRQGDIEIYAFPQTWSDTSLGFGGVAGQAFTSAYTTVIVCDQHCAAVYIGGRLAYLVEVTPEFMADVGAHNMAGLRDGPSRKYKLLRAVKEDAI